MKHSYKRGFTLIELLVVIAIIGILAAIILASLATARSKGNDAKVESQLQSIQQAAEIYYSSNGSTYGGTTCNATTGMGADTTSGMATLFATGSWPNATSPICQDSGTAYLVYHALSSNTAQYWCVDSSGQSKLETSQPGTGIYVCP